MVIISTLDVSQSFCNDAAVFINHKFHCLGLESQRNRYHAQFSLVHDDEISLRRACKRSKRIYSQSNDIRDDAGDDDEDNDFGYDKKDSKSDYDSVLDLDKYAGIPSELLPRAECLKLTKERFMLNWENISAPAIKSGKRVIITA